MFSRCNDAIYHLNVDLKISEMNSYPGGNADNYSDRSHGTQVAGIVVLNGPDNVKIINVKVHVN